MADRPTETTAAPQSGAGSGAVSQDTVAIPRTPARGTNGTSSTNGTNGTSNGAASASTRTAPVLPPTPAPTSTRPVPATPAASPATPPRPTREQRRAAKDAARQAELAAAAKTRGRKARLRLTRVDPWSVMKTAFLLSIALGIVTVVSVIMVWSVLGAADVWQSINKTVQDIVGGQDASSFNIEDYIGTRRVVGFTMIVAAVDVVLVTAIATLGAFLYNMSASLLGGIEVTLAEDA